MKKGLLISLSVAFIFGGCLLIAYTKGVFKSSVTYHQGAHADWPAFSFQTLTQRADLVAVVHVEKGVKVAPNDQNVLERVETQESTLTVNKMIYGSAPSEIVLKQAVNFEQPGQNYLMFLKKSGEYYFEVDDNSVVAEIQNKYNIQIPDFKGKYNVDEFIGKFQEQMKMKK